MIRIFEDGGRALSLRPSAVLPWFGQFDKEKLSCGVCACVGKCCLSTYEGCWFEHREKGWMVGWLVGLLLGWLFLRRFPMLTPPFLLPGRLDA